MIVLPENLQTIYDYIIEYKSQNDGNTPATKQIMAACGISSTSMVSRRVNELIEAGLIERGDGKLNIRVVGAVWMPPEGQ